MNYAMKHLTKFVLLLVLSLLLTGCYSSIKYGYLSYVEDNINKLVLSNHKTFCEENPEDMFCKNDISIGDIQPTQAYALGLAKTMFNNTSYKVTDRWYHNKTVYEHLTGDCEDVAMTIVNHMIDDGIDRKYIVLVYRMTSETTAHMFVAVNTIDAGWIHIDYENSGYPLEDRINHHMLMTDVGVYKWIKGNIVE